MNIGVLGAGSWAIALSVLLDRKGHSVTMWEFSKKDAEMLKVEREHKIKLPGVILNDSITVTDDITDPFEKCDYIIVAVPAQFVRNAMKSVNSSVSADKIASVKGYVIVSKGIEISTLSFLNEVVSEELDGVDSDKIVVLSGPSHAEEVSRFIPTSVVAASTNQKLALDVQKEFSSETFRIYTNSDVTGVELCASVKNVIALAAGISDGLGFGDNTKGALLTRGMVEMVRLGKKLGASESTFFGLAGFGDLITTCTSKHSRNRRMGELVASGLTMDEALSKMTMVAEGVPTTEAVNKLAQRENMEMPITTEVYNILYNNKNPREAVSALMLREFKPE